MLGRISNAFLIVGVEHRGLNIGVAEHVLDLVQGCAVLEGDGGGRVAQGVGGDPSDVLGLADQLIEESCLPHIVPHHILNDPHPDGSTAPSEGGVVRPRAIGPWAAGPTKEGVVGVGRPCVSGPIRLVPLIVILQIGRQWSHDPRF